jgi:hypothetical protein
MCVGGGEPEVAAARIQVVEQQAHAHAAIGGGENSARRAGGRSRRSCQM